MYILFIWYVKNQMFFSIQRMSRFLWIPISSCTSVVIQRIFESVNLTWQCRNWIHNPAMPESGVALYCNALSTLQYPDAQCVSTAVVRLQNNKHGDALTLLFFCNGPGFSWARQSGGPHPHFRRDTRYPLCAADRPQRTLLCWTQRGEARGGHKKPQTTRNRQPKC